MHLLDEERFALEYTLYECINDSNINFNKVEVIDRDRTGVGFFTTVKLAAPLLFKKDIHLKYWERNFEHKKLLYGGCFMVQHLPSDILEIEAVAFDETWPEPYCREDFVNF